MKIHSFSRSSLSVVSGTRGRVLSALPFSIVLFSIVICSLIYNDVSFLCWRLPLCVVGGFLRCVFFCVFFAFSGRCRGLLSLCFWLFGVCILFCAFCFRGLLSLCFCLFVEFAF